MGPPLPQSFIKKLENKVEKFNITIYNDSRVTEPAMNDRMMVKNASVTTSSKKGEGAYDLVLFATGIERKADFLPKEWVDSQSNSIMVSSTFLVEGTKNVFAIGDCNNLKESNM